MAIVSQSGGLGITILHRALSRGIGVGQLVVAGNELDVSIPEYLEASMRLDDVRAVLCYMEAVRDPEGLLAVARFARESAMPLVMLKAGRSRTGQRAAAAHTGALATSGVVFDGLLGEAGAAIAWTIDEAIFAAGLLSKFGAAPWQALRRVWRCRKRTDSTEAFQAMTQNPAAHEHMGTCAEVATSFEPRFCTVESVHSAPE